MGKIKKLNEIIEHCINKSIELKDTLPNTGIKYLQKAKKDYFSLPIKKQDEIVLMKIKSIAYSYSNPGEPIK